MPVYSISRCILALIIALLVCSIPGVADPPASSIVLSQAVPRVSHNHTENSETVVGGAPTGQGVVGVSNSGIGVQGSAREGRGVVGVSGMQAGVEGRSQGHVGVWGATEAPSGAGGECYNYGGGDLIRAGADGAFCVSNNGDVFIRGQRLSTTGQEGPPGSPGLQGPPGPPGPPWGPVRTVAVCGGGSGQGRCHCTGREIARQIASPSTPGCSVTSDTGACAIPVGASGVCCVCAP